MRFALTMLMLLTLASCAQSGSKLCDNVTLMEGSMSLNANERVLVCGSGNGPEGWRDVPLPQAEYQLKVLFQHEGYFQPRFERERDQLRVWAGPRRNIREFRVEGGAGILQPDRKRKVRGEPLLSDKLNEIEKWADTELRSKGYACPGVDVRAEAWSGDVTVVVEPGRRQRVGKIEQRGLDELDDDVIERYLAFRTGDVYDVREQQLTTTRMLVDGLVQSAYFTTRCRDEEVDLALRATLGEPRLLTFGIGASTEEFPFFDIRLKNTRLDGRASSLTTALHLSPRIQTWETTSELYWVPWSRHSYFGPRFTLKRESERAYEYLSARAGADLGRSWDIWDMRVRGQFGPTLNYVNTVRGVGPDDVSFLSWEGKVRVMSHNYEAYVRDQVEGWEGEFDYRGQREGLGSYLNVDRYELDFKHIWNLGNYSPPFLVLASRIELIAVDADAIKLGADRDVLPQEYRIFYGGDQNLRGFGRQILNNGDLGYLSAAYLGFELRMVEELPWRLQPFLLWDMARLGNERYTFEEPIFASGGIGLRWPSPFGTLRGSAARGRIFNGNADTLRYPEEWVYFISFGQEF